jgi:PIN domain nuclease of toxin-antitoxin system
MKYLLDTHIVLWYLNGDERLPTMARTIIDNEENEVYFSLVSMWEIEIKHIAHPEIMQSSGFEVLEKCKNSNFEILPLFENHIKALHTLRRDENAPRHNDPFDRMLISQAKAENITFITHDSLIPAYNEPCILSV